jgi:hypothetical protein
MLRKAILNDLSPAEDSSLLGCDTVSLGDIPDIVKHHDAFILNCLILEEEGVTIQSSESQEQLIQ